MIHVAIYIGTIFAGFTTGFCLAALLSHNKIEESYVNGYRRGRSVSENSVNNV